MRRERLDAALDTGIALAEEGVKIELDRDAALARLDDVLAALGVFGSAHTGAPTYDPTDERVRLAQAHLDRVLAEAMDWRDQAEGQGYIHRRARTHARMLFRGTPDE